MTKHQLRLLLCAGGALGAMVASMFVLAWFRVGIEGIDTMGFGRFQIDLRSIHACNADGTCVSVPMSKLEGLYPTMSTVTFGASCVLGVTVAYQTIARLLSGHAGEGVSRLGYLVALIAFCVTGATAYFFEPAGVDAGMVAVKVTRSWAPVLLLAGDVLAIAALYLAHAEEMFDPSPAARVTSPTASPPVAASGPSPVGRARTPSRVPDSIPLDAAPDASIPRDPVPRARKPSRAPSSISIAELTGSPELHGKLRFATSSIAISAAGLDARHEDGVARQVAWREIVGVVVRRLPDEAPYRGATIIDVVSTAGATLRILPWTALDGVELAGDGDARVRAFVELVVKRCPEAKLDGASRAFVDGRGLATQLPTTELLAEHDRRLA